MKIHKVLFLSSILFSLLISCDHPENTEEKKLPNVVFILADDMGYGDPSCYNPDSKIKTKNIDALAVEGMMFLDAHAPAAWCVPSRYGLITGRYPAREKMNWRERSLISNSQETLATLFKKNGYKTACIGKWHLGFDNLNWDQPAENNILQGGPTEKGFDYFFGMHASLDIPPYFYIENNKLVEKATELVGDNASVDATSYISGAFWRKGAIAPNFKHDEVLDKFVSKASTFVENHLKSNGDTPFFLYVPLTAPHTPWLPKEAYTGKSDAGEYGDFVLQVDQTLGNIRALIDRNGLAENTIFVFSSDNGPVWFQKDIEKFQHDSKAGLKGMKIDFWEGGSRVPFIVSWEGHIPKGTKSNQLLCFTDMMATFATIIGDATFNQNNYDSYDLSKAMLQKDYSIPIRKELLIQDKIFRKDNYKLILGSGLGGLSKTYDPDSIYLTEASNQGELYDLSKDLNESNNLYDSQQELVESLKSEVEEILTKD